MAPTLARAICGRLRDSKKKKKKKKKKGDSIVDQSGILKRLGFLYWFGGTLISKEKRREESLYLYEGCL